MKVRFRFVKSGSMKFIGHLDCMRFFQKAFRRAGLDIAYSQGFSPHQRMGFASPLGLGLTSDGEYLDAELNSGPQTDAERNALLEHVNRYMTDEIFIRDMEIMPDGFKNSMSLFCAADYMVIEKEPGIFPENYKEQWTLFLSQPRIEITKKTKKSEKRMDIRPFILKEACTLLHFQEKTGENYGEIHCPYKGSALFMQLTSGSEINIKPELVMEAFFAFLDRPLPASRIQVHRLQMYFSSLDK